ncbi:MAG: hypothetical protein GYB31_15295 [Bacteroidetes bacterium]|nr:hypothetical protein [Bacteroidota bacterium]
MFRISLLLPVLLFVSFEFSAQETFSALEQKLFEMPDVMFEKLDDSDPEALVYKIQVKQPLDHNNPEMGWFWQRAFLTHRGFDNPTLICTEGYNRPRNRTYELSLLLQSNQIDVEHRFFGTSRPDSLDYRFLNLEQVTADLHKINTLFKEIYAGKWVSTGISKGGSTTIFYRYFYPEDVDVSIPYVAPINIAYEEPRIYQFLDTIGTDACRKALLAFQKRLLKNREAVLPLIRFYSYGAGYEYTYLNLEEAFEYAVLEYPFSFWQYGQDCAAIPDKTTNLEDAVKYFLGVSDIGFFSDAPMVGYGSHYYQAATEMGYYGYETEDFKGLLKALPMQPHPHAAFMPNKIEVPFDGSLLEAVNEWLPVNGDQFIYINGAIDTWSASAVAPNDQSDALWFFMDDKHHGNARIRNMSVADQDKLIGALERWLDMEIDKSNLPDGE